MTKVYCIKNFIGEKNYEKFDVNNIYNIKCITDNVVVICFKEDSVWSNSIVFQLNIGPNFRSFSNFPFFEDYFMELKDYRKAKLQKILEIN